MGKMSEIAIDLKYPRMGDGEMAEILEEARIENALREQAKDEGAIFVPGRSNHANRRNI